MCPTALRKAETLWSFGLSEGNKVNQSNVVLVSVYGFLTY